MPKNAAETVAKSHDVEYGRISKSKYKTKHHHLEAVRKADAEAIKGFQKTSGVSAKIGEYGLKLKTKVESILGKAIYPSFTGNIFYFFFSG